MLAKNGLQSLLIRFIERAIRVGDVDVQTSLP